MCIICPPSPVHAIRLFSILPRFGPVTAHHPLFLSTPTHWPPFVAHEPLWCTFFTVHTLHLFVSSSLYVGILPLSTHRFNHPSSPSRSTEYNLFNSTRLISRIIHPSSASRESQATAMPFNESYSASKAYLRGRL